MTAPFRDDLAAALDHAEQLADENRRLREELERLRGKPSTLPSEEPPQPPPAPRPATESPPESMKERTLERLERLSHEIRRTRGASRAARAARPTPSSALSASPAAVGPPSPQRRALVRRARCRSRPPRLPPQRERGAPGAGARYATVHVEARDGRGDDWDCFRVGCLVRPCAERGHYWTLSVPDTNHFAAPR